MNDPIVENPPARELTNPYAPPRAEPTVLRRASRRLRSGWLYAYIATQGFALLLDIGVLAGEVDNVTLSPLVRVLGMVIGLGWLQRQWARLPTRLRTVRGNRVTPSQAGWWNVVPVYGVYWMFAVNVALCLRINSMLEKTGRPPTAPTWLAVICPITVLAWRPVWRALDGLALAAVYFGFGVLWILYMLGVQLAFARAKTKGRAWWAAD